MKDLNRYISEFIGTFFIIFIGCGSIIVENIRRNSIGIIGIALAFGITTLIMVVLFKESSGAHFNPAISFASFIRAKLSAKETALYILSQLLGGIVAGFILAVLFARGQNMGIATVDKGILTRFDLEPKIFIIITEFIFSFLLMFAYSFSTQKNIYSKNFSPFLIGSVYFLGIILLYKLEGAGLNPIRIIVPALYMLKWELTGYYIGALFAGATAGGICSYFVLPKKGV